MWFLLVLTFLLSPLYVWRFNFGGIPTNFLMLLCAAVILIGAVVILSRGWLNQFIENAKNTPRWLLWSMFLFGLASLISLFAFGFDQSKFGQWIVLYAEPIALFFLIKFFAAKDKEVGRHYHNDVYLLLGLIGIVSIVQYLTLWSLPPDWWGNANEPKRAIGLFGHPNGLGLFAAPLLTWLLPDVWEKLQGLQKKFDWQNFIFALCWFLGGIGVFLSLSRGAWFGLAAAAVVFALASANKKIIASLAIIFVIVAAVIAITPNLRYRLLLPFYGEKSAIARVSLWQTGSKMVKDNPVLGKGVNGFKDNWEGYNSDSGLQHYNFPHNIFLNFWIDSGLLGLLSMLSILAFAVWHGWKHRKSALPLGLLLFVVTLTVHGLIDIPYLKNDLALVFWTIFALSI